MDRLFEKYNSLENFNLDNFIAWLDSNNTRFKRDFSLDFSNSDILVFCIYLYDKGYITKETIRKITKKPRNKK